MNRHSIRFRIAVIISLAIAISLGGFAVFLTTEIGSVNERDETAKLKSSNDMLMSMIAQTDSILREQAESWSHVFAAEMAGSFSLEGGETPILKFNVCRSMARPARSIISTSSARATWRPFSFARATISCVSPPR